MMTMEESAREHREYIEAAPAQRNSAWNHLRDAAKQRWFSMLLGSGLLLGAKARRSLPLALAGGMLVYRGATGRWPFFDLQERPHPATSVPHQSGIKVERSISINESPENLYRFWRDLENLPRFMSQVESVNQLDEIRSHWKVTSLAGATLEWDAEIINDLPGELLAWRSLEGADIDHAGSVHFEPDPHVGARVRVVMEYRPPAGTVGAEIARWIGQEPGQILDKDLHRLKQLMEAGDIATVQRQPQGGSV